MGHQIKIGDVFYRGYWNEPTNDLLHFHIQSYSDMDHVEKTERDYIVKLAGSSVSSTGRGVVCFVSKMVSN